jgi:hypothetical protein
MLTINPECSSIQSDVTCFGPLSPRLDSQPNYQTSVLAAAMAGNTQGGYFSA